MFLVRKGQGRAIFEKSPVGKPAGTAHAQFYSQPRVDGMDHLVSKVASPELHSCGIILLRCCETGWQFLLLRHADRWDLPKGLVEPNETPLATALRELVEETGIPAATVRIIDDFQFTNCYQVVGFDGQPTQKRLTIFLGVITGDPQIVLTEHVGFQWFAWRPPHQLEPKNVDQVLAAVERFGWPRASASGCEHPSS